MKTALIVTIALITAVSVVPTATAAPPGLCDYLNNTMCHVPGQLVGEAKDMIQELKDPPCTCDPQPDPGP